MEDVKVYNILSPRSNQRRAIASKTRNSAENFHKLRLYDEKLPVKIPLPRDERERLQVIKQLEILDTPPDKNYDRFTVLAAKVLKVRGKRVT